MTQNRVPIMFQQDGYAVVRVWEYLNNELPEHWLHREGFIN